MLMEKSQRKWPYTLKENPPPSQPPPPDITTPLPLPSSSHTTFNRSPECAQQSPMDLDVEKAGETVRSYRDAVAIQAPQSTTRTNNELPNYIQYAVDLVPLKGKGAIN